MTRACSQPRVKPSVDVWWHVWHRFRAAHHSRVLTSRFAPHELLGFQPSTPPRPSRQCRREVTLPHGLEEPYIRCLLKQNEQPLPPAPRDVSHPPSTSPHSAQLLRNGLGCPPCRAVAEFRLASWTLKWFAQKPNWGSSPRGSCPLLLAAHEARPDPASSSLGGWEQLRVRARRLARSLPLGIDPPKVHFCPTCRGGHPQPLLLPAQS
jgi:hypothetical protein